ncbi:LysR family transcriptional regulator [Roseibium sp. RKSG952]|uniref:LysR family transcriptional regulator n=1 Tax=Roseibium sp. RKSG952 TaxID=2529384 RepID=UPI0012BCB1AE|nr:LysR family transcriptional regulator [Roseibium sp. RKSG952]MTH98859.1 LysR family transcriptional regulator [Roseibium sp. RKSG952]
MAGRDGGKLSLSQLRALEAVVRTGSFSLAAKELGVSQPSISNHIQALENRFKTRLLKKTGYTVSAMPALDALLPRIRAVLALCMDIETELVQKESLAGGQLRIGYSTYQIAIPRISAFMNRFPNISIEARAMATQDLLDLMDTGEIDVGFITAREIPSQLAGVELLRTRIVLAARPDHPLAGRGPVSWRDVEDVPLIQREGSSGTRKIFDAAATVAGASPQTVLALGSWGSIATLIQSGVGLGVAMEAEITERDGFVPVPLDDPALYAKHFLVCPREMAKVSAVQAFFDHSDAPV